MNVFGNPITNSTLAGMPEYAEKEISRRDRATVALNMKNADGKAANVLKFVEETGRNSNYDRTTQCVIYNATGDTITFVRSFHFAGDLCDHPYPMSIDNGQWGGFVHHKGGFVLNTDESGSKGCVVYRAKNLSGKEHDWAICWNNWSDGGNHVYSEVDEKDHYQIDGSDFHQDSNSFWWKMNYSLDHPLQMSIQGTDWQGFKVSIATGKTRKAVVEAIITLTQNA